MSMVLLCRKHLSYVSRENISETMEFFEGKKLKHKLGILENKGVQGEGTLEFLFLIKLMNWPGD